MFFRCLTNGNPYFFSTFVLYLNEKKYSVKWNTCHLYCFIYVGDSCSTDDDELFGGRYVIHCPCELGLSCKPTEEKDLGMVRSSIV